MVEIAILSIFAGQTRPIRKSGWLKIFPGAFMNPTADAQFLFQPNNTFLFAHYGAMFFIADHDCPYHEAPSGSINRFHRPPPRPHPGFGHGHGGFGHGHGGFGHGHGGFGHGGHGHGHFHFGKIVSTRRRNDKRCHCCINIFGLQLPLSDLFVLFR
ncbi:hypothetical protein Y032_0071g558 [Ancylostoma ceylanicum]|uniref:Uncharacterized protein n=1 Tax=Ancylostoma ceylanicum TaxID=53326 RepID=A0A016TWW0_9BILA|nr:hypothetical protein Y032_0071g558 [Ancylostoma ceylanicum]